MKRVTGQLDRKVKQKERETAIIKKKKKTRMEFMALLRMPGVLLQFGLGGRSSNLLQNFM